MTIHFHLATIGWALITLMAAYGLGERLLRLLRLEWTSRSERAVYAMGLGLAGLALLTLGGGAVFLLRRDVFIGVSLLLGVWSARPLAEAWRDAKARPPSFRDPFVTVLVLVAAALALLTLSRPLSPTVHSDSLAYHLAVPQRYLELGGIVFLPDLAPSNWQFIVQMLHLWSLALDGPLLAQLLNHAVLFLAAAATGTVTARHFGPRAGAVALLIVIGLRTSKDLLGSGTDMFGLTLYSMLLLGAWIRWWEAPEDRRTSILLGLCLGCCAATKLLGLVPSAIILSSCVARMLLRLRTGGARGIGLMVLAAVAASVAAGPYYLKNWILSGNPVYPFAFGLFGGRAWNGDAQVQLWTYLMNFGQPERDLGGWLRMPFQAVLLRSSLALGLLPLALLVRPRDWRLGLPFLLAGILVLLWWCGSQQSRFLLPARAVMAVPAGAGMAAALERLPGSRWRRAAGIGVAVLLIGDALAHNASRALRQYPAAVVAEEGRAFLRREVEIHGAVEFVNATLPPNARVLLYNDARTFHIRRATATAIPHFQAVLQWNAATPPDALADLLRRHGFTHVLVNCNNSGWWDGGALRECLARHSTLIFHDRGVFIYRIESRESAPRRRNLFRDPPPARIEVSSIQPDGIVTPDTAVDGDCCGPECWISERAPAPDRPEWLALFLAAPSVIRTFRVFTPPRQAPFLSDFVIQVYREGRWEDLPGARIAGNRTESDWTFRFPAPVRAEAFRILVTATTGGPVMLREVEAWED
jgi:hypothetical protein